MPKSSQTSTRRPTDTHPDGAVAHAPNISPCQGGSIAHPQPGIPHQANHGGVHRAPVAGAGSVLQTAAPNPDAVLAPPCEWRDRSSGPAVVTRSDREPLPVSAFPAPSGQFRTGRLRRNPSPCVCGLSLWRPPTGWRALRPSPTCFRGGTPNLRESRTASASPALGPP